jgi:hypothetical protein
MLSTMPVVLVHGNPETDAIWGPLVDALGRDDVVPLSPPGFVIGGFDPDYVWHDLAQIWQTPGEGERWVDETLGGPLYTERMVARGVPMAAHLIADKLGRRAAGRAGARTEVLDGLGHWWMVQDPVRSAVTLNRFWETLD